VLLAQGGLGSQENDRLSKIEKYIVIVIIVIIVIILEKVVKFY